VDYSTIKNSLGNTVIIFGSHNRRSGAGIELTIHRSERSIHVSGWFDNVYGIEGGDIKLDDLTELFGRETRG